MKTSKMHNNAIKAYKAFMQADKKSGTFHRGIFHLHTPASYDYLLFQTGDAKVNWSEYSEEQIYDRCCRISEPFCMTFPRIEDIKALDTQGVYASEKECLAFSCLALMLIRLGIEFVVVTDHNTISGSEKLQYALEVFSQPIGKKHRVSVIHGIEISCADRVHVVVIYDHSDEQQKHIINNWLCENRISEKDGVVIPSLQVLTYFIKEQGFIAYIAHINTTEIFNDGFLTEKYKKRLFELNEIPLVGVKEKEHIDRVSQRINALLPGKECNYILDNDAHSIDTIANRYMYILGNSIDYKGLQDAIMDYDVCIHFSSPTIPSIRLIGIDVPDTDEGFLHSSQTGNTKAKSFSLGFSSGLNCIIGGRGSGKSTILHIISLLLGGKNDTQPLINLLCRHQNVYLYFSLDQEIYCSVFSQPVLPYGNDYCDYLRKQIKYDYRVWRGEYHHYERIYEYLNSEYVDLYRIVDSKNMEWEKQSETNKKKIQKKVFNSAYSINEIVSLISSDNLHQFIHEMIFSNLVETKKEASVPSIRNYSLEKYITIIVEWNEKRKWKMNEILTRFNSSTRSTLRLSLSDKEDGDEYLRLLLPSVDPISSRRFLDFDISQSSIYQYLIIVMEKIGIIPFLRAASQGSFDVFFQIAEPVFDLHKTDSDMDRNAVKKEQQRLISEIFELVKKQGKIESCIDAYIEQTNQIQLEFNLNTNNSSDSNNIEQFRRISELSMGQKVVAILSFILLFGEFSGDNTPLVIDQPEDNLDSQYIYENLVKDLRKMKETRQVIIATHNATLVTNCKAEKIIVMKSDNQHGWVETTGYPTKKQIAKKILQYLEGGEKSFIHRQFVYRDILD